MAKIWRVDLSADPRATIDAILKRWKDSSAKRPPELCLDHHWAGSTIEVKLETLSLASTLKAVSAHLRWVAGDANMPQARRDSAAAAADALQSYDDDWVPDD